MKRRNFLSLIGAATVAPALPAAAFRPTPALMAAATTHAQTYPYVSVMGVSRRIGVSVTEAENLMTALSREGVIGNLRLNGGARPVYASSKIYVPTHGSAMEAARLQKAKHSAAKKVREAKARAAQAQAKAKTMSVDLGDMLAHLRDLCVSQGMVLHPRCFAIGAA